MKQLEKVQLEKLEEHTNLLTERASKEKYAQELLKFQLKGLHEKDLSKLTSEEKEKLDEVKLKLKDLEQRNLALIAQIKKKAESKVEEESKRDKI